MSAEIPIRILFAEDQLPIRMLGEVTLSALSRLQLTLAEDGDQAVELLRGDPNFHILATDRDMPGHSGLEVIRYAREVNPNIRTVLITASGADIERDTQELIDRIVRKPYSPGELIATIGGLIKEIDATR